jgi:hypothetical protein
MGTGTCGPEPNGCLALFEARVCGLCAARMGAWHSLKPNVFTRQVWGELTLSSASKRSNPSTVGPSGHTSPGTGGETAAMALQRA